MFGSSRPKPLGLHIKLKHGKSHLIRFKIRYLLTHQKVDTGKMLILLSLYSPKRTAASRNHCCIFTTPLHHATASPLLSFPLLFPLLSSFFSFPSLFLLFPSFRPYFLPKSSPVFPLLPYPRPPGTIAWPAR